MAKFLQYLWSFSFSDVDLMYPKWRDIFHFYSRLPYPLLVLMYGWVSFQLVLFPLALSRVDLIWLFMFCHFYFFFDWRQFSFSCIYISLLFFFIFYYIITIGPCREMTFSKVILEICLFRFMLFTGFSSVVYVYVTTESDILFLW